MRHAATQLLIVHDPDDTGRYTCTELIPILATGTPCRHYVSQCA